MFRKRKPGFRKVLRGLLDSKDEGSWSYFDTAINRPDEFDLAGLLLERHSDNPITESSARRLLLECLRELYPNDLTPDDLALRAEDLISSGFVERWNSGLYW